MADPQVVDIELDRERALTVRFDDEVTCVFPVLELRMACPCATCRNRRDADEAPYKGSTIAASDAELHGNWGISIRWSDGHSTGVYPWRHLRAWRDATDGDLYAPEQ